MVGLTKMTTRKKILEPEVTFEVLRAVLAEIECVINDKSITYTSSDVRDLQPF